MFPPTVWKVQIAPERHRSQRAAVVDMLATGTPPMPELADGEGWQSGHSLHECADLQPLVMRFSQPEQRRSDQRQLQRHVPLI